MDAFEALYPSLNQSTPDFLSLKFWLNSNRSQREPLVILVAALCRRKRYMPHHAFALNRDH